MKILAHALYEHTTTYTRLSMYLSGKFEKRMKVDNLIVNKFNYVS